MANIVLIFNSLACVLVLEIYKNEVTLHALFLSGDISFNVLFMRFIHVVAFTPDSVPFVAK